MTDPRVGTDPLARFRTIEVSDPAFESAGLRHLTVKTPNLRGRGDITIFIPRQAKASDKLPVVTLLHGVYGSHWAWTTKAGAHITAQRLIDAGEAPPMLLAMPSDGLFFDGTGYIAHNERRFDAWVLDDVPAALGEAGLPAASTEQGFIAGLSMGGYGALRLAASHPGRFIACAGHSSITEFDQLACFVEEDLSAYGPPRDERSVLAAFVSQSAPLPRIRFDCGVDDDLIDANRALHAGLDAAGITHEYHEYAGGHEWPYWSRHIEDTLRFFARSM